MDRTPDEISDIETLKKIQFYSYPAIMVFSAGLLTIFRDSVAVTWSLNPWLVTPLALVIVILIGVWISATVHEFQLWQRYLCFVFIRQQVYAAMFGIAFLLGTMLVFAVAFNIVIFTGFFSTYLLFNYWTQWVTNEHFKRALISSRKKGNISESEMEVLSILNQYWLSRPQLARIATMMYFSMLSFCLAFKGINGGVYEPDYSAGAYLLIIFNIIIGEAVINRWRNVRDNKLQPIIDK